MNIESRQQYLQRRRTEITEELLLYTDESVPNQQKISQLGALLFDIEESLIVEYYSGTFAEVYQGELQ